MDVDVAAFFEYDPACERPDTVVRAIWDLCRRGYWRYTADLGLDPERIRCVMEVRPRPNTRSQVFSILQECPEMMGAVEAAIRKYLEGKAEEREFYFLHLFRAYARRVYGQEGTDGPR